jgi:hypothetical protein
VTGRRFASRSGEVAFAGTIRLHLIGSPAIISVQSVGEESKSPGSADVNTRRHMLAGPEDADGMPRRVKVRPEEDESLPKADFRGIIL